MKELNEVTQSEKREEKFFKAYFLAHFPHLHFLDYHFLRFSFFDRNSMTKKIFAEKTSTNYIYNSLKK